MGQDAGHKYIRLELDKLETSAVNLDDLLTLGGIVLSVGFGSFLDGSRVFSLRSCQIRVR